MKKHTYFITAEAVKYWKKEVKSGRLHVATKGDKIYIVNGYNAFVIPNNNYIFSELVQPATLRPAPEDGRAYIWRNGEFHEEPANDTVNMIDRVLEYETAPVTRSRFRFDTEKATCCIYKLHNGDLAIINEKFVDMVDFSFRHTATMANNKAPAVFTSDDFTAILMPMNPANLETLARELTAE